MRKRIKYIITAVISIAIFIAILFQIMKPLSVEVVVVAPQEIEIYFEEEGIVKESENYTIIAQASGIVNEVFVKSDEYIEAGTILAQIDTKKYEDEIQVYENNILNHQANRNIAISQLGITQVQTELEYAKNTYQKYLQLYQSGSISQQDYQLLERDYRTLEQSISLRKQQESSINSSYDALIIGEQQAIERTKEKIEDCVIRADKAGYIMELPLKQLSYVEEGASICMIREAIPPVIECYVDTEDVVGLLIGDIVKLSQTTRTEKLVYQGVIKEISDSAVERTSLLGTIEHRVKIIIEPVDQIATAKNGYNLDVKFITYYSNNSLVVPNSAVFEWNQQPHVYILENNLLKAIPVVKGGASSFEVVITEGIKEGDQVVKNMSLSEIREGIKAIAK